jgi:uncharacterized membrane protein
MDKIYQILAIISLIFFALFFWIQHEKKSAKNEITIEKQEEQIQVQNEIIKENKEVFERKTINKSFTSNANLQWLYQNICKNCKN